MQAKILGSVLPVLHVSLDAGEKLISETGELSWKSPNVSLRTGLGGAGSQGFLGALKRTVAGGGLFMTEYVAEGGSGFVAIAAKIPGKIEEHQVQPGRAYMVHRHGFVCGTDGIELSLALQRSLGAGIFGGDGFRLQRVSGYGRFWTELGGEVVSHELAPGEAIDVHPGHVGMFEESVDFSITMLPGLRNKLFGGDGFFIARMTGPGRVWLQTLTLPNLAHALSPYLASEDRTASAEGTSAGILATRLIRKVLE